MYLAEREVQPDRFGTVPDAMWWAIATVTTIGLWRRGADIAARPHHRCRHHGDRSRDAGAAGRDHRDVVRARDRAQRVRCHARDGGAHAAVRRARLPRRSWRSCRRSRPAPSTPARSSCARASRRARCIWSRSARSSSSGRASATRYGPGDAFGGHHDDAATSLAVRAVKRSRLLIVEEHDLLELCDRLPGLAERIAALVAREPGASKTA